MIHVNRHEVLDGVGFLLALPCPYDTGSVSDALSVGLHEISTESPYTRTFEGTSDTGPFSKVVLRTPRVPSESARGLVILYVGNGTVFTIADLTSSRYFSSQNVELASSAFSEGISSFRIPQGNRTLYWEFDNETGLLGLITVHNGHPMAVD